MHDTTGCTGWTGRLLRVDLGAGTTETIQLSEEVREKWLGGRGLAGHLLRPFVTLDWDHPDMPVIFMAGPLVGTASPTSGRGTLMSRSPLTGAVGDCSFGGGLATRLKKAGWDGVLVTGRSDRLAGIEISDGEARVVDAEALRGIGTSEVFNRVGGGVGRLSVACIGPAGENGSLPACVAVDRHHAAGRTGLGASLGAKKLKYLSVRGTGRVAVADAGKLETAREDIVRLTRASPALMGRQGFAACGTGAMFDLMDARRMMPTDNFRRTRFEGAARLNAHAFNTRYEPEPYGCEGCHIRCMKVCRMHGEAGRETRLPGFEAMSHLTALIENRDMDVVMEAAGRLGDLGLDMVGAGAVLACHKEIEGLGPLGRDEIMPLLEEMASGSQGLGAGSRRYAEGRGAARASMSVKGLELSAYDPRGAYGLALACAVNVRGGDQQRACPVSHEILRKPVATDRFSFSGKARMIKIAEDVMAAVDSLAACRHVFFAAGLEEYAAVFAAVTGRETTGRDLLRVGERISYHERVMNHLNGFDAEDDDLPVRFFTEEGSSGEGVRIAPLDRDEFLEARARYYRIRGLDGQGRPLRGQAETLGVAW